MSKSKKIIGVKAQGYPEKRNFFGLEVEGYKFKKCWDLYKFPAYLYFSIKKDTHPKWLNLFWRPFFKDVSVYHFFNAVNRGNQPWIVTFECFLPRGAHRYGKVSSENSYIDFVISRLVHPSCRKIIAMSEFAKKYQQIYMKEYGKYQDEIMSKIEIIHPSQKAHLSHFSDKPVNRKRIRFVLIGADFFRKGGMEILKVFEEVLYRGAPLELHLVSTLNFGDYATHTTAKDQLEALEIIKRHTHIYHYPFLPNDQVIELLINSDIGLLPSYDETYGYSVLEAQACGCPVVTTSGGVFKEINNDGCGWVIDVPLNPEGGSIPRSTESKQIFSERVVTELHKIIEQITHQPEIIYQKGIKALDRIKAEHDPVYAAKRLKEIYDAAV